MANGDSVVFETQRDKLLKEFAAANQPFEASTKPYKSTQQWDGVIPATDEFPVGAITMGHLVYKPQNAEFFGYGIGDAIAYGPQGLAPPATRQAVSSDTNLTKRRNTNGNEDFVIEGISCSVKGMRFAYPSATYGTTTDPDVVAAYQGLRPAYDPASLASPPQVYNPFNLENGIANALLPLLAVTFNWDRNKIVPIGTLDQMPEGAGKSFLRSNGQPMTGNRYMIPEGYIWRRTGSPDSEFTCSVRQDEALVIPISFVQIKGTGAVNTTLTDVLVDLIVRLHGLSCRIPSGN